MRQRIASILTLVRDDRPLETDAPRHLVGQLAALMAFTRRLGNSYAAIEARYDTLLTMSREHSESITDDLAELMGAGQYQDAVQQRVERLQDASLELRTILDELADRLEEGSLECSPVPVTALTERYLSTENRHAIAAQASPAQPETPADSDDIELF